MQLDKELQEPFSYSTALLVFILVLIILIIAFLIISRYLKNRPKGGPVVRREFKSLGEASLAIGRWEGYISEALKNGSTITNKSGKMMHVHVIGKAYVVKANEIRQSKKEKGLLSPKKERKKSEWAQRKSLRRIETGQVYASMSEADRAMGRPLGYLGDCIAFDRDCFDRNGNKWTFEFLDQPVKIRCSRNECYFEEYPDKLFSNLAEASEFIDRNAAYISDRTNQRKPILTKEGQELHLHFKNDDKEDRYQPKILF